MVINILGIPWKLNEILQRPDHCFSQINIFGTKDIWIVSEQHWKISNHLTQLPKTYAKTKSILHLHQAYVLYCIPTAQVQELQPWQYLSHWLQLWSSRKWPIHTNIQISAKESIDASRWASLLTYNYCDYYVYASITSTWRTT